MYNVTPRERTVTLAGILVALFLGALDQTVVATAMPSILKELNGLNLYTWVVTGYLLASTAMIPIYGKLSDLYGRKAIVLVGTIIFLAGSILSGQARSMVELIAFRAIQGLGSAGIFSTAFTVVADLFPPADRGKFQGLFGGVFGIASIVGPWLGGLLTDALSWRWVFYLNMPFGIVALLLIVLRMPPLKPQLDRAVRIDWWGSVMLLAAVVPILLALSLGGTELPWGSSTVLGLFGLGVAGLVAFLLVERRAAEPILPFALFRNRTFVIGTVGALLVNGVAFFGAIIFLPIFMVMVVGVSASAAGLTIMPLTLGVVFSSIISGQLVSRLGKYKLLLLGGIAVTFAGYLFMNGLRVDMTQREMTWRMVLLGLGIGPALPVFTQAIQNAVPPAELGTATSSNQFFRQIGATIGIAIFGTIMSTVLAARMPQYLPAGMAGSGAGRGHEHGGAAIRKSQRRGRQDRGEPGRHLCGRGSGAEVRRCDRAREAARRPERSRRVPGDAGPRHHRRPGELAARRALRGDRRDPGRREARRTEGPPRRSAPERGIQRPARDDTAWSAGGPPRCRGGAEPPARGP